MTSPHEQKDQWIQQGPGGANYYVRKKTPPSVELPSFKAIFREAFHDLRHGYPSGWREWKRQNKEKRKLAKEAKKAAATAKAAAAVTHPNFHPSVAHLPRNLSTNNFPPHQTPFNHLGTAFSNINLSQSNVCTPFPAKMSTNQSSQGGNGNDNNQSATPRGILKPELQRYPSTGNGFPPWQGMPLQPPVQAPAMPQNPYQAFAGYPPQVGYGTPSHCQPSVNQNFGPHQPQISQFLPQGHLPPGQPQPQMPPGPTQPPGGWPLQPLPPGARAMGPPRYPTAEDLKHKCAVCNRYRSAGYHYRHPLAQGQLPPKSVCRKCRSASTDSEDDSRSGRDRHSERSRGRRERSRSVRRVESVGPYLGRTPSQRGRPLSRTYSRDDDSDWYANENRRLRSPSRSTSVESMPRAPSRARSRSVVSRVRIEEPVEEEIVVVKRPRRVRRVIYVDDDGDDAGEYSSSDHRPREHRSTHQNYPRAPTPAPRPMRSQRSDPGLRSPSQSVRAGYFNDSGPYRAPSRQASSGDHFQSYSSEYENDWYANAARGSGRSGDYHGAYRNYDRGVGSRIRECDEGATVASRHDGGGSSSSQRPQERPASRSRMPRPPVPDPRIPNLDSASTSDDYDYYDKDGMRVRVREI